MRRVGGGDVRGVAVRDARGATPAGRAGRLRRAVGGVPRRLRAAGTARPQRVPLRRQLGRQGRRVRAAVRARGGRRAPLLGGGPAADRRPCVPLPRAARARARRSRGRRVTHARLPATRDLGHDDVLPVDGGRGRRRGGVHVAVRDRPARPLRPALPRQLRVPCARRHQRGARRRGQAGSPERRAGGQARGRLPGLVRLLEQGDDPPVAARARLLPTAQPARPARHVGPRHPAALRAQALRRRCRPARALGPVAQPAPRPHLLRLADGLPRLLRGPARGGRRRLRAVLPAPRGAGGVGHAGAATRLPRSARRRATATSRPTW